MTNNNDTRWNRWNDKRHNCGKLAPNLFFLFEILVVLEVAYVAVEILAFVGMPTGVPVVLAVGFVALLAVGKFWDDRRRVLERQKGNCPEASDADT